MEIAERVGHNIKRRMIKGHINRLRLSTSVGISWGNLDAILNGLVTPTLPTLERIAKALTELGCKTDITDLLSSH